VLPRLLAPAAVEDRATGLLAAFPDGRRLRIDFEPERECRIGALRILSSDFELHFEGWSDGAIDAFMRRCEQGLQQGGG
jgi:hypothetical protein